MSNLHMCTSAVMTAEYIYMRVYVSVMCLCTENMHKYAYACIHISTLASISPNQFFNIIVTDNKYLNNL